MGTGKTHLSTWISSDLKERFKGAAARQGLRESALLRRLVEQMLAAAPPPVPSEPSDIEVRDARISVRLIPKDRLLLHERATGRGIPSATYVSILVRSHLRSVVPLPETELTELRRVIVQLSALARYLNAMARTLQENPSAPSPGRQELAAMMKIAEGLRDHIHGLIRTNATSWTSGHAPRRP